MLTPSQSDLLRPLIAEYLTSIDSDPFLLEHGPLLRLRSRRMHELLTEERIPHLSGDEVRTLFSDTDSILGARQGRDVILDGLLGEENERVDDVQRWLLDFVRTGEGELDADQFNRLCDGLKWIGPSFLSEFLMLRFPERYWIWNGPIRKFLERLYGEPFEEWLPHGKKRNNGERYVVAGQRLSAIRDLLSDVARTGRDFIDTDLFIYWASDRIPAGEDVPRSTAIVSEPPIRYGKSPASDMVNRLVSLFPDEDLREIACTILADAVDIAHNLNPNNWVTSWRADKGFVRLSVGQVETTVLRESVVDVFVLRKDLDEGVEQVLADRGIESLIDSESKKSITGEVLRIRIPAPLLDIYRSLRNAHRRFIEIASSGVRGRSIYYSAHQPALIDALGDLLGRDLPQPAYLNETDTTVVNEQSEGPNHWWLNCNPKIWDVGSLPIGGKHSYTALTAEGTKRQIYRHFIELRAGDLMIAYETSPTKVVQALLRVVTPVDQSDPTQPFSFEKVAEASRPLDWETMTSAPELSDAEPIRNNQGSLFRLKRGEFEWIVSGSGLDAVATSAAAGIDLDGMVAGIVGRYLPEERVLHRRAHEERARTLLREKVGRFTIDEIRAFCAAVNADLEEGGAERSNRLMPALYGSLVNMMAEDPDAFNRWAERIWQASDEETAKVLDAFWRGREVKGAGISLPTAILYLRDPDRYALWLPVMQDALERAFDLTPGPFRRGLSYLRYNEAAQRFRERFALAPEALDLVLWRVSMETAPEPPDVALPPSPIDPGVAVPSLRTVNPAYPVERFSAETGIDEVLGRRWIDAVNRKGQAIIYGPPGTGKTWVAERLARHLIGGGTGFVELVQFHPAYSYEDFIIGIRPSRGEEGQLTYDHVPGRFLQFCARAEERGEDPCVLIVDEINRANLARVFGELMYLLEYRSQTIPLASGRPFSIPENVRIIGTMNTADRSIALVDHALRRRFAFIELAPQYALVEEYHRRKETGFDPNGLLNELRTINDEIDPHYRLGTSFFLRHDLAETIEDIWRMEIVPYLEEYFFDQPERMRAFMWEEVSHRIFNGQER